MEDLKRLRAEIDGIDAELARLFAQRMAAAAEIAAVKREQGLPVRDPAREREVLALAAARIADPALAPRFAAVMEALMAQSRAYQEELGAISVGTSITSSARRGGGPASRPVEGSCPHETTDNRDAASNTGDGSLCSGTQRTVPCVPGIVSSLKYPIYLERGSLQKAAALLDLDRRIFIVTDDGVPAEYAAALAAQCREATVYTVPQGERSKSPETLTVLLEAMLRAGLTRGDCVAAVGGGVVGDLAGLAAALYMRGVDWYNVPTTLLAMVDSSVGGKTAVDLGGVKNAAGAFWSPRAVLIDPDVLKTLSPRHWSNGLAEAVKMALTHDAALFDRFEDPVGYGPIEDVVAACLRIKAGVVAADGREAGLRRVLNLGHTLGHGLEAASEGRLLHGEAVALGMIPLCAPEVRERLLPVLERLGLPTYGSFALDVNAAMEAISHDKKGVDGGIETVTVPEIGTFQFRRVGLTDLERLLRELFPIP